MSEPIVFVPYNFISDEAAAFPNIKNNYLKNIFMTNNSSNKKLPLEYEEEKNIPIEMRMRKWSTAVVKSVYKERFTELLEIINSYDPIGMLSIGAEEEEYDLEVRTIIVQLDNYMTVSEIYNLVRNEFILWFSKDIVVVREKIYKSMAEDIHRWIKNKRLEFNL